MGDGKSVSHWIDDLKSGDPEAAKLLWNRYFGSLTLEVRRRLRPLPPGALGSEDIAASVFESLWEAARAGRLNDVQTRDELWWLLLTISRHKTIGHVRRETSLKRGGGVRIERLPTDSSGVEFDDLVSEEPSPEYCVMLEEEFRRLLSLLRDEKLRQIAVLKMEGYSNDEICETLNIASATATRKLKLIRSTWAHELSAWTD